MAKQETDVTHDIMLAVSPLGCVVWKNVRGLFYTLDKKRKVRAGIQADGSSDLIGGTRKIITQDMVGQQVFILTVIEVKTPAPNKTYPSTEQKDFVKFVLDNGGYAGVARCAEDAKGIISPPAAS